MMHALLHLLIHWSLVTALVVAWLVVIAAAFYAEPIVLGTKLGRVLYGITILLLLMATVGWCAYGLGDAHGQAAGNAKVASLQHSYAEKLAEYQAAARRKEHDDAVKKQQIDAQYAREMKDAQAIPNFITGELRAGHIKLRKRWDCPAPATVSAATAGQSQIDAAAALRTKREGQVFDAVADQIKEADEADATIRALQATVKADRH